MVKQFMCGQMLVATVEIYPRPEELGVGGVGRPGTYVLKSNLNGRPESAFHPKRVWHPHRIIQWIYMAMLHLRSP